MTFLQLSVSKLFKIHVFWAYSNQKWRCTWHAHIIIRINSSSLSTFCTVHLWIAVFLGKSKLAFFLEELFKDSGVKWRSLVSENNKRLQCVSFKIRARQMSCYSQHLAAIWTDKALAFHPPSKIKHLLIGQWVNTVVGIHGSLSTNAGNF